MERKVLRLPNLLFCNKLIINQFHPPLKIWQKTAKNLCKALHLLGNNTYLCGLFVRSARMRFINKINNKKCNN